ncbi:MAG TPA: ATP-binding protein [Rhodothermales bacterium]|nr:ATP-binding protein [Rhodothermales bacterium]
MISRKENSNACLGSVLLSVGSVSGGLQEEVAQVTEAAAAWSPWMILFMAGACLFVAAGLFLMHRLRRQARRDRILFQESPEPTVLTDLRWKIVEVNQAACDLFGYTRDHITRLALNGIIETKTVLEPASIKEAVESGEPLVYEATVEQETGNSVDLAATTRKVRVGSEAYLLTAFHEITRHKDEQRLFKAFHRRLVEDLPIEIVVTAPQGQYLYANPKAIPDNTLREFLMGETDVEFCQEMGYHPEVALLRRSHRRRVVSTKMPVTFEETLPGEDGSMRTFTRIFNPVLDKSDNVTAVVVYGVETTELKSYQDQMEEIRRESERLAELKESFLANISHEFRTPLTGILGFGQLLQEDVDPDAREFVDIILRNGRRLMSTLNAMVDLSKLHSNYLEMNPTVFNLVDEVKQVAQSVSILAQEKDLYLRMRATRPEILVRLDRTSLFRVLENLIGNAIKFTHQGGVIVEVHGDSEHVYVRVMDSGIGIRNEFLPFLFEEFNQESSGLSRDYEGTGIGLSVVKRLIDLMNGSISVDSEKGEGSMFTITFPAAFPQVENGESIRSKVLVADESEEVHTLIQYVLSPYFDVEYASDFPTAVRAAKDKQYDVVLIDAEFGNAASAAEALAPIRELTGYDKVPVIALDPHPVHGSEVHFLTAGYDDCLHKPLDKKMLLDSIGHILSKDYKRRPRITASSTTTQEQRQGVA